MTSSWHCQHSHVVTFVNNRFISHFGYLCNDGALPFFQILGVSIFARFLSLPSFPFSGHIFRSQLGERKAMPPNSFGVFWGKIVLKCVKSSQKTWMPMSRISKAINDPNTPVLQLRGQLQVTRLRDKIVGCQTAQPEFCGVCRHPRYPQWLHCSLCVLM